MSTPDSKLLPVDLGGGYVEKWYFAWEPLGDVRPG